MATLCQRKANLILPGSKIFLFSFLLLFSLYTESYYFRKSKYVVLSFKIFFFLLPWFVNDFSRYSCAPTTGFVYARKNFQPPIVVYRAERWSVFFSLVVVVVNRFPCSFFGTASWPLQSTALRFTSDNCSTRWQLCVLRPIRFFSSINYDVSGRPSSQLNRTKVLSPLSQLSFASYSTTDTWQVSRRFISFRIVFKSATTRWPTKIDDWR